MVLEQQTMIGVAIAALGGSAVGLEREWSGHASGPEAHFAGLRTFTLLGGLAGLAGYLWSLAFQAFAVVLLAGAAGLVVAAYIAASRRHVDGTTEVAALVVLAAGVLSGTGSLVLGSGVIAVTTLLLVEKSHLHATIARIDDAGLRAGIRFAVMAVVILPLLPHGPFGPFGGIRPRQLWLFVLLFSGLSFLGYIARRLVGVGRGYSVTGLLGGLISSTAVTFTFSRISRQEEHYAAPLALGVVGACTVMNLRVLLATLILRPGLALALLPYVAAPFLAGLTIYSVGWRRKDKDKDAGNEGQLAQISRNPLQIVSALEMTVLFQIVLFAVYIVRTHWGQAGLLWSGAALGFTDVDALTVSMAKGAEAQIPVAIAAQAIAVGVLSNTVLKFVLAVTIGKQVFRRWMAVSLATMAVASLASIIALR